jgi:hypothetical protein
VSAELPRLSSAPERVFVSVDESTGRSTVSFAPADVGPPIVTENDGSGDVALRTAREIAAAHTGCTVLGPHYFASANSRRRPRGRR